MLLGVIPEVDSAYLQDNGFLTDGMMEKFWYSKGHSAWAIFPLPNAQFKVGLVLVTNRCGCCGQRLSSAAIYVRSASGREQLCGRIQSGTTSCLTYTVDCAGKAGVRVILKGGPAASTEVVEVQAFEWTGVNCSFGTYKHAKTNYVGELATNARCEACAPGQHQRVSGGVALLSAGIVF